MINLKPCPFCGGEDVKVIAALDEEHCVDCWLEDLPSYGGKSSNYCVVCLKCQGNSGYRRTPQEAIDNWNSRPVAKKTKVKNLKHLLDLVSLNPDLPVLPIVDTDCVVSDDYGYWLASIGSVEVTKILDDINYCKDGRFYREDDFDEIVEDLVSESDDPLDEEEAEDIVKNYPWRKVILVYIIPG